MVAIYCVWDHELLRKSVDNIKKYVDEVIIVYSNVSNFGSVMPFPVEDYHDCVLVNHEPDLKLSAEINERAKRNTGLEKAKELNHDYFVMMDADEFYNDEFVKWYDYIRNKNLDGLVCKSQVYFKLPTLQCDDTTLVTFIHRVTPGLRFVQNRMYPFAFHQGFIRIDPTRTLNIKSGVELIDYKMDHFSWVRKDYSTKVFNSTARENLLRSTIFDDLSKAEPSYYCNFYKQRLRSVENIYQI